MVTDTTADDGDVVASGDLFEQDKTTGYMQWLDEQHHGSVVYVSFGSLAVLSAKQLEYEIRRCLEVTNRPFIWVVRRDNRDRSTGLPAAPPGGMVVQWCVQARVLAHSAVGCFVTHCGWNSMLESIACGVPVVMAPQWSDQATNARMAEARWGVGVRADAATDGTVHASELARCIDAVMGDSDEARAIRHSTRQWKARAAKALDATDVDLGGTAACNLRRFLQGV